MVQEDPILRAIIERRRAFQQQQALPDLGSSPFGFIGRAGRSLAKSAFNDVVKPVGGGALNLLDDFTKKVENEPVEKVLAIPALRRIAQGKQPFWFDASKEDLTAPNLKLGTPKQVATRNIRTYTDELADQADQIPLLGGAVSRGATLGGRGLEGAASLLLDPTNLMAIGIARKGKLGIEGAETAAANTSKLNKLAGVLAETAGRGTQSKKAYLATQAGAGFASGVGGELAGTPGSLIGGFAGGWGTMSRLDRARRAAETSTIEAARVSNEKQNFRRFIPDVENGQKVSDVQYPRYQTLDGERTVVDINGLSRQIAAREASQYISRIPEAEKMSRAENTQALKDLVEVMRTANTPNILVDDIWDTAKTASKYMSETRGVGELGLKHSQMQQLLTDITKDAEQFGDYRFTEESRGTLKDILKGKPQPETPEEMLTLYHGTADPRAMEMLARGEVHPGMFLTSNRELAASYGPNVFDVQVPKSRLQSDDFQMFGGVPTKNYTYLEGSQFEAPNLESSLAQERDLRTQLAMNKEAEPHFRTAHTEAGAAKKAYQKEIVQQFPKGSRTAVNNYLKTLVQGGDVGAAFDLLQRRTRGMDLSGLDEAAAHFVDLHQAERQAKAELDNLLRSRTDLGVSHGSIAAQVKRLAEEQFGAGVKALQGKLIQIPGQSGRYRVKSFGFKNGQIGLDLEYVAPKKSISEAIGEGAEAVGEQQAAVRNALQQVKDLRAEQARLRKAGADVGDIADRIKAAEAEARSLELVRPVTGERPAGTRFISLNDATEFSVLKPGKVATPRALSDLGIRDARTISLLNQESAARANIRTAEANLQALTNERARLAGINPQDPQLARLDESIAGTQSQLDLHNAQLEEIDAKVAGNQQALEATISTTQEEADILARQLAEGEARREAAWQELSEKLSVGPEAQNRRFLDNVRETDDVILNNLRGQYSSKRLTQGAYDQLIESYQEMAKANVATLSKPAQEAYGSWAQPVETALNDMGARQAIAIIQAPTLNGMNLVDPDAMRNGLGGLFRRTVLGTGMTNAVAENDLANFYRGQSAAAQMADLGAGQVERHAANLTNKWLEKVASVDEPLNPAQFSGQITDEMYQRSIKASEKAAWARSVMESVKDPMERMEAVLRNAAKPITDQYWVKSLGDVPENYRQQIYEMLSGNFLHATKNPGAYVYEELDPTFANTLGQYRKQAKSVEDLAGAKGLMRNLLKQDYREYAPVGRIPMPDGSIRELKTAERTDITDLWEILAKADADPKRAAASATGIPQQPLNLADMMIPTRDWGTTQAANVLNKVNEDAVWRKVATQLKDPKAVERLRRGEAIAPNEWKDAAYGEDFGKLQDELNHKPVFGMLQKAADTMNRIAASTITGDGSFAGVQGLIGMAMSPSSTAKLLTGYYRNALSDEGWLTLSSDPTWRAKFIDRVNRGMGVGRSSVTGMESGGNIFQQIPGLKRVGNVMAAADKITFDRMQTINKMNLIDTMEADIQMLRAFGPRASQQFVDGIPSLERLNQEVNLFQSTPEEISNAIIRQANNALGGLSRQQSLLGRQRQAVETTLLFVPGFFRARGGLINSVSKMLRNPDSPEGYLAASLLAREAFFRTAFAASVAEITGTSDEFRKEADSWALLDPRKSGGMLTGPLGDGGYLGLSWGNQAPKLYAQLLAGNRPGEFNLDPRDRLNSIQGFFEGRSNPVVGAIMEQVKGQDFLGRPVQSPRDRMVSALQAVAPMFLANTVSEGNEAAHAGNFDPRSLLAKSGAEFIGLNARAPLPSEQLNSAFLAWQEKNFPGQPPVDWKNAPSGLKQMARDDKAIVDAEEAYTTELGRRVSESATQRDIVYRAWDEKNAGFGQAISRLSQQLASGQISAADFKAGYSSLQEDRADAASDFRMVLAKAGVKPKDEVGQLGASGSGLAHLMAEYNAIKPETISGDKITDAGVVPDNDIDWTRFKQERQAVLDRYPPEVQAQFKATQTSDDQNVRRLQDSRTVLDTYFDQMPKYRGLSNIEGKTLDAYKSILNASTAQYSDLGVKVDRQQVMLQTLQRLEAEGKISNPRQAQIAALALKAALDSKFAVSIRNLGAIQYLLQNPDVFQWYPWLEAEIPSQLRPLLGGGTPMDTNAILQRELRGASLSSVR